MLVNSVNISVKNMAPPAQPRSPTKNLAPPAQARTPTGTEITQKGEGDVRAEKGQDLSRLTEIVADVQKSLNMIHGVDLQFSVHEASGELMVTVIDGSSGEVIREVPPSEILDLAAKMDEMIGRMFDQKG